jgi:hydroxypyruvate isomerase
MTSDQMFEHAKQTSQIYGTQLKTKLTFELRGDEKNAERIGSMLESLEEQMKKELKMAIHLQQQEKESLSIEA